MLQIGIEERSQKEAAKGARHRLLNPAPKIITIVQHDQPQAVPVKAEKQILGPLYLDLEAKYNALNARITRIERSVFGHALGPEYVEPESAPIRALGVNEIIRAASVQFRVSVMDIKGRCKQEPICIARQVAMYLAKTLTGNSLPFIGRQFGDRDHTTVIHAVKKIKNLLASCPDLVENVSAIKAALKK